jgi:hypothetical protein
MEKMINLETFAGGALAEQINTEIEKVVNNIYDPNTDAKRVRKLTLTLSFKPNQKRSVAEIDIQAKTTLAPFLPTQANIMIDKDLSTGKIVAAEIGSNIPGQIEMEIDDPEPKGENVIDLKMANSK